MRTLYFDIETAPKSAEEIERIAPPFNPDDVKRGNISDPEKIAQKIESERSEYIRDIRKKAALSPVYGKVVAIGARIEGKTTILDCFKNPMAYPPEAAGLIDFWSLVRSADLLVGFNTHHFDLPFLIKRSWELSVNVPECIIVPEKYRGRRMFSTKSLDLAEVWQLGDPLSRAKLDTIAKFLGIEGKTGDHGAHFAGLWTSYNPEDRAKAVAYLEQDVALCEKLHKRLTFAPVTIPALPNYIVQELP